LVFAVHPWVEKLSAVQEQRGWALPVGLAVVALVVVANAGSSVGLGTSGNALVVTLAVAVYAAAALSFLLWFDAPVRITVALLLVMAVASAAARHGDPTGTGGIGLYLGVAYAPLRLPRRAAVAVAAVSVLIFDVLLAVEAPNAPVFITVVTGGAALFFLFGLLLRSEQEQRARADRLVTELELSREAEKAAAALAERTRLSREMHDVLAHTLSGLVLQLEALTIRAERAADPLAGALARAYSLARDGLGEARQAIAALRGESVPGPQALPELVARHTAATAAPCTLDVRGEPRPLAPEASLAVYRTVQEALTNVRKHAPGAPVRVRLDWQSGGAVVEVYDHGGRGSGPLHDTGGGRGLTGLAERAALLGGRLEAGPADDGFRVRLEVPA
jgi:signal transduction histidine kinase